eukprot:SAG31_NODE_8031_length_1536_cov_7.522617_2_plen_135_part_00
MIDLIIKADRPNLSDSSLKQYLIALKKLNNGQPIKDIEFLKDYDAVMEKLSKYSNNTKKGYLNAVIVALNSLKAPKALIEKYEKHRDQFQTEYSEIVSSHQKTEKQHANWVNWDDWVAMTDKLNLINLFFLIII